MNAITQPQTKAAPVFLELLDAPRLSAFVGQKLSIPVRACTANGEELIGASLMIEYNGAIVSQANVTLPANIDSADELPPDLRQTVLEFAVAKLELVAPGSVGAHEYEIVFPAQSWCGTPFAAERIPLEVHTECQPTSMAVWDLPTPVIVDQPVRFKAGVRSHDGFSLAGQQVKLLSAGAIIAEGMLGDAPLSGTEGLYWTEMEANAPATEGVSLWTVVLDDTLSSVPHTGCSADVTFFVSKEPDTQLTVIVTDRSGHPVEGVLVRPGPFNGITDRDGVAAILVTRGQIELAATKDGYAFWTGSCAVDGAMQIIIELDAEKEDEEPLWI